MRREWGSEGGSGGSEGGSEGVEETGCLACLLCWPGGLTGRQLCPGSHCSRYLHLTSSFVPVARTSQREHVGPGGGFMELSGYPPARCDAARTFCCFKVHMNVCIKTSIFCPIMSLCYNSSDEWWLPEVLQQHLHPDLHFCQASWLILPWCKLPSFNTFVCCCLNYKHFSQFDTLTLYQQKSSNKGSFV